MKAFLCLLMFAMVFFQNGQARGNGNGLNVNSGNWANESSILLTEMKFGKGVIANPLVLSALKDDCGIKTYTSADNDATHILYEDVCIRLCATHDSNNCLGYLYNVKAASPFNPVTGKYTRQCYLLKSLVNHDKQPCVIQSTETDDLKWIGHYVVGAYAGTLFISDSWKHQGNYFGTQYLSMFDPSIRFVVMAILLTSLLASCLVKCIAICAGIPLECCGLMKFTKASFGQGGDGMLTSWSGYRYVPSQHAYKLFQDQDPFQKITVDRLNRTDYQNTDAVEISPMEAKRAYHLINKSGYVKNKKISGEKVIEYFKKDLTKVRDVTAGKGVMRSFIGLSIHRELADLGDAPE